jgi:hypothetical protein
MFIAGHGSRFRLFSIPCPGVKEHGISNPGSTTHDATYKMFIDNIVAIKKKNFPRVYHNIITGLISLLDT